MNTVVQIFSKIYRVPRNVETYRAHDPRPPGTRQRGSWATSTTTASRARCGPCCPNTRTWKNYSATPCSCPGPGHRAPRRRGRSSLPNSPLSSRRLFSTFGRHDRPRYFSTCWWSSTTRLPTTHGTCNTLSNFASKSGDRVNLFFALCTCDHQLRMNAGENARQVCSRRRSADRQARASPRGRYSLVLLIRIIPIYFVSDDDMWSRARCLKKGERIRALEFSYALSSFLFTQVSRYIHAIWSGTISTCLLIMITLWGVFGVFFYNAYVCIKYLTLSRINNYDAVIKQK